jgi:formylglycine-generating enzyme required for sulfatase activity
MQTLKQKSNRCSRRVIFAALGLLAVTGQADDDKRNLAVAKPADAAPANEQRVALVIGNSNYKSAPLKNPVNDAEDIAKALKGLGFQVTLQQNQSRDDMARAIREFGNQLKRGGTGLFYYAGHGMQVKGKNFLIPVDADIQSEDEVPYRGIDANELLAKMESARNRVNLVILDACRNNPFARSFRSSSQGLAQMDAPVGTLIAFATAPGSVAADGQGRNGLYTQHLLASMNQPGLKIEDVFKRVRAGVRRGSGDKQVPWENTSLEGDFYFKPGAAAAAHTDPAAIELAFWESIKDSTSSDDYKAYLKKYPNGQFADLAGRRALNPPKPVSATVASIAPAPAIKIKPEPSPGEATGRTWVEPVTGMEFVWIPKGCFRMGSPENEKFRGGAERLHQVCVDGFWLSKYEVTNSQYRLFRPSHQSGLSYGERNNLNGDKQPVVRISWQDAMRFAQWLSEKGGPGFRLPTESEWEYAARAGTTTAYYWGNDFNQACRYANVGDRTAMAASKDWTAHNGYVVGQTVADCADGYKATAPVGSFGPNAYGLHDMLGNVQEWTASVWDPDYAGAESRVASPGANGDRVVRGGNWTGSPRYVRSASRFLWPANDAGNTAIGFRLAREP